MPGFVCSRCGQGHGELPLSYAIGLPDRCFAIPEAEREARVIVGDETCSIDDREFFLRGNIAIPITDYDEAFIWTVWVALSRRDFKRALAKWMRADRVAEPPYDVALATELPCYPPTMGLSAVLTTRPVGFRPDIRLVGGSHPLAAAQASGIALAEVQRIAELVVHGPTG